MKIHLSAIVDLTSSMITARIASGQHKDERIVILRTSAI